MILIADSGSTKTTWCVIDNGQKIKSITTKGINPFFQSEEEISKEVAESLLPHIAAGLVSSVYFYGAGCVFDKKDLVKRAVGKHFTNAVTKVDSDIWAAIRGVCGKTPGIVCIMGTGSNSCFFDGEAIAKNVSPLGFILGDEGSGAVLGKLLVGDILKNQLPEELREKFFNEYKIDQGEIIDRVYRKPFPNRFLAGFSPFLLQNIDVPAIRNIVVRSFTDFFRRNVMQYDYNAYEVNFVGSVSFHYREILKEVGDGLGIRIGQIVKQPMEGLIKYHSEIEK